jgi:hypothetical protein
MTIALEICLEDCDGKSGKSLVNSDKPCEGLGGHPLEDHESKIRKSKKT